MSDLVEQINISSSIHQTPSFGGFHIGNGQALNLKAMGSRDKIEMD